MYDQPFGSNSHTLEHLTRSLLLLNDRISAMEQRESLRERRESLRDRRIDNIEEHLLPLVEEQKQELKQLEAANSDLKEDVDRLNMSVDCFSLNGGAPCNHPSDPEAELDW